MLAPKHVQTSRPRASRYRWTRARLQGRQQGGGDLLEEAFGSLPLATAHTGIGCQAVGLTILRITGIRWTLAETQNLQNESYCKQTPHYITYYKTQTLRLPAEGLMANC